MSVEIYVIASSAAVVITALSPIAVEYIKAQHQKPKTRRKRQKRAS